MGNWHLREAGATNMPLVMAKGPPRMRTIDFLQHNARWLGAGMALMAMSSFGQTFFISIFADDIQTKFNLSHGTWGIYYAIGTTASAAAMVWAGTLTDVYRARTLGFVCLFGLALSCLFMAFNPIALLLPLVIFCLRLFGQGMMAHIAIVAMARWFVSTRGRALATASLGYSIAEMSLPILFVFLVARMDWHFLWVLSAGICIIAAFGISHLLKEERIPGGADETNTQLGLGGRHWTRAEVITHPLFWFLVPAILGLPAFGTAVLFHQVHYAEIKEISHLTFVSLIPVYSCVSIGSMIISGIALDRFGTRRLIAFFPIPVAFAFVFFGLADSAAWIALAFFFFGLTAGAYGTLTNAFWAETYGTAHIGAIKSLATAIMVLGSAVGPALTGILIDRGIPLDHQYFAIGLYFLIAAALIGTGIIRHTSARA